APDVSVNASQVTDCRERQAPPLPLVPAHPWAQHEALRAPHLVIWAARCTGRGRHGYVALDSSPASATSAVSAVTGADSASISESVSPEAFLRRCVWYARPVPAGIRRPTMTFSLRPRRPSRVPRTAASVRTRVVSWNAAAEMNDSVASEALVMPSSTGSYCGTISLRPATRAASST